jgi:FtsP/CotA-like multicopper oxidase with cupredoxin domain
MINRRTLLQSGVAASAAILARARLAAAQAPHGGHGAHTTAAPIGQGTLTKGRAVAGEGYTPVVMPNGSTLPFENKGGVKVFHLIAQPVKHVIAPGLEIEAWGYNGSTPGPLIECVEIPFASRHEQAAGAMTVHWHGVICRPGWTASPASRRSRSPSATYRYNSRCQGRRPCITRTSTR